jgi:8-oxo-dGTP pyrophosphatase MutT (NUDIX family)
MDLSASTSGLAFSAPAEPAFTVEDDRFGNVVIKAVAWDARLAAAIDAAVDAVDLDDSDDNRRTSVQVYIPLAGLEGGVLPAPKPGVNWAPYVQTLTHNALIYDPHNRVPAPYSSIGGAQVCILTPGNTEVLCTRKRGETKYGAAGGAQDRGEHFVNTAKREVQEELGLDPARLEEFWSAVELTLIGGYTQENARNYGGVTAADTCLFLALTATKETMAEFMTAAKDADEIAEAKWIPVGDLGAANTYASFLNAITTVCQEGSSALRLTMVRGNERYSW